MLKLRAKVAETASNVSDAISEFRPKIESVMNSVRKVLYVAIMALATAVTALLFSVAGSRGRYARA